MKALLLRGEEIAAGPFDAYVEIMNQKVSILVKFCN